MWNGFAQVCALKKWKNDVSSDARNFFLMRAISNLDTFLETWGNSLQHMWKSAKNSNSKSYFWRGSQNSPNREAQLGVARGAAQKALGACEDDIGQPKNGRQIDHWVKPLWKSGGRIFFIFCLHPNMYETSELAPPSITHVFFIRLDYCINQ